MDDHIEVAAGPFPIFGKLKSFENVRVPCNPSRIQIRIGQLKAALLRRCWYHRTSIASASVCVSFTNEACPRI